jgi:ribonuclease HII
MLKPYIKKDRLEVGCDEAGRGCLAGPVVAAAVVLPQKFNLPVLNDSKKLSEKQRNELRFLIEEIAIDYAVAFIDNYKIDEINILNASILGMHEAINQLKTIPEFILVDGNKFKPYKKIPHSCIIKGDGKYASIAAASILAKTYRDEFMEKLHTEYPGYNWKKNKGYPTKEHKQAIVDIDITKYHRKSFKLKDTQIEIPF